MYVSGYMVLKIRVGRIVIIIFFKQFYFPEVLFIKAELESQQFSVCHVVSRLVAPSFSLANSLISTDTLPAVRERYKNKTESIFCENQIVKIQKRQ